MDVEVLSDNLINNNMDEFDFKNLNGCLIHIDYIPNNNNNDDNNFRLSKFYYPMEQKYHPTY
jgi:hypothetical protein